MQQLAMPLVLLVGLAAMMFFASRRQRKAAQATIDLHDSLGIGDRVHTSSGLQGTIARISDDDVDLEIAPGVVTTWMKMAIRDRIEPEEAHEPEGTADAAGTYAQEDTAKTDG
jgi:preprotein translocase subunit YajC